ncbi:hypothetical protein SEVIR_9G428300v4 [Setaria viridis]|uniref:VQ domain-containing protein n=2 Tax=Setaria TaxID=4554 RepID=K4AG52_SETIT|nr:uncharacterized protein LOC101766633 [Setaria italica]XP_034575690.1 uncharacterized protein LOC117839462 [Setaria viridis]RCV45078.1 hypothetical protein SETIT_9G424100v2 [Setaria italica]TKV96435.1 hypothetical protein SEVIR_9G428300v2 [Setaria viridis]
MDSKLGVQHRHHHHHHNGGISKPPVHHHYGGKRGAGRQGGGGGGKGIKVVYISSPMKLTASAEEFRAVVQELTGRDSNVADHDLAGGAYYAGEPASSSSSYSSFGRVSPTEAGPCALPPTMATGASVGAERAMAAPPPFQGMYDQTAGNLLYGQDYW